MPEAVVLSLKIYALAIVISLVVAAMIKVIVVAVSATRSENGETAPASKPAASARPPDEHVAAVAAAVYACLGAHRIVHIKERGRDRAWTAEGRTAHHVSHNVPHLPHR